MSSYFNVNIGDLDAKSELSSDTNFYEVKVDFIEILSLMTGYEKYEDLVWVCRKEGVSSIYNTKMLENTRIRENLLFTDFFGNSIVDLIRYINKITNKALCKKRADSTSLYNLNHFLLSRFFGPSIQNCLHTQMTCFYFDNPLYLKCFFSNNLLLKIEIISKKFKTCFGHYFESSVAEFVTILEAYIANQNKIHSSEPNVYTPSEFNSHIWSGLIISKRVLNITLRVPDKFLDMARKKKNTIRDKKDANIIKKEIQDVGTSNLGANLINLEKLYKVKNIQREKSINFNCSSGANQSEPDKSYRMFSKCSKKKTCVRSTIPLGTFQTSNKRNVLRDAPNPISRGFNISKEEFKVDIDTTIPPHTFKNNPCKYSKRRSIESELYNPQKTNSLEQTANLEDIFYLTGIFLKLVSDFEDQINASNDSRCFYNLTIYGQRPNLNQNHNTSQFQQTLVPYQARTRTPINSSPNKHITAEDPSEQILSFQRSGNSSFNKTIMDGIKSDHIQNPEYLENVSSNEHRLNQIKISRYPEKSSFDEPHINESKSEQTQSFQVSGKFRNSKALNEKTCYFISKKISPKFEKTKANFIIPNIFDRTNEYMESHENILETEAFLKIIQDSENCHITCPITPSTDDTFNRENIQYFQKYFQSNFTTKPSKNLDVVASNQNKTDNIGSKYDEMLNSSDREIFCDLFDIQLRDRNSTVEESKLVSRNNNSGEMSKYSRETSAYMLRVENSSNNSFDYLIDTKSLEDNCTNLKNYESLSRNRNHCEDQILTYNPRPDSCMKSKDYEEYSFDTQNKDSQSCTSNINTPNSIPFRKYKSKYHQDANLTRYSNFFSVTQGKSPSHSESPNPQDLKKSEVSSFWGLENKPNTEEQHPFKLNYLDNKTHCFECHVSNQTVSDLTSEIDFLAMKTPYSDALPPQRSIEIGNLNLSNKNNEYSFNTSSVSNENRFTNITGHKIKKQTHSSTILISQNRKEIGQKIRKKSLLRNICEYENFGRSYQKTSINLGEGNYHYSSERNKFQIHTPATEISFSNRNYSLDHINQTGNSLHITDFSKSSSVNKFQSAFSDFQLINSFKLNLKSSIPNRNKMTNKTKKKIISVAKKSKEVENQEKVENLGRLNAEESINVHLLSSSAEKISKNPIGQKRNKNKQVRSKPLKKSTNRVKKTLGSQKQPTSLSKRTKTVQKTINRNENNQVFLGGLIFENAQQLHENQTLNEHHLFQKSYNEQSNDHERNPYPCQTPQSDYQNDLTSSIIKESNISHIALNCENLLPSAPSDQTPEDTHRNRDTALNKISYIQMIDTQNIFSQADASSPIDSFEPKIVPLENTKCQNISVTLTPKSSRIQNKNRVYPFSPITDRICKKKKSQDYKSSKRLEFD